MSPAEALGDTVVSVRSLYRFFHAGEEETLALRGVSLQVARGQVVAVTGPSGSGKSTLLSCIAGLDEPDGGTVWIEGRRMSRQPEPVRARLRAERIGYLGQSANLFEHLTIEANVAFVRRLSARSGRGPAVAALEDAGLAPRARAYPGELSGGEAARAGLAVALAGGPAVLLADEPTGELDSAAEDEVLDLLLRTAAGGVAVVVASHSPAVAALADRVVHLHGGRVVA